MSGGEKRIPDKVGKSFWMINRHETVKGSRPDKVNE